MINTLWSGNIRNDVYIAGDETQNKHNPSDWFNPLPEASLVVEGS